MPNRWFKIFLVSLLFFVFLSPAAITNVEAQEDESKEGYGLGTTKEEVDGLKEGEPRTIVGDIVGIILSFVGVIFFILIIYGGLLWMTARGNEQQIEKAKNLMGSAIIGLIIVLAAYAITAFIGSTLTG